MNVVICSSPHGGSCRLYEVGSTVPADQVVEDVATEQDAFYDAPDGRMGERGTLRKRKDNAE